MSRRGLAIRAAVAGDAPAVADLLGACGHAPAAAQAAERLAAIGAGSGTALAAWEWGPPSGLIVLHWFATLQNARPVAQIDLLVVDPAARRRGLGRLLVKAASQAARVAGCGAVDLLAAPGDEDMVAFCRATGFVARGAVFSRPLRKGE